MGAVVLGRVGGAIGATRLAGWAALVLVVGGLNFAGREAGGAPDRDVLYRYSTAVSGVVLYAIVLGLVLLLARGLDTREVLALRRPRAPWAAAGYVGGGLLAIFLVGSLLAQFLDAGREQGLVPTRWQPDHAGAFAANFAVVVLVAPFVEELVFRGFGVTALEGYAGPLAVSVAVGVAFGVWHGLVIAFPALAILGAILAAIRLRTDSVFPAMATHALFNAISLIAAVTVAGAS